MPPRLRTSPAFDYTARMTDAFDSHRRAAQSDPGTRAIACAILTVSDTRNAETDVSGDTIDTMLRAAGHEPRLRAIVRDEPDLIRATLETWIADETVRAVLVTGGTGLGRRDTTIEVVRPLLTAELDGFGELFRVLSHAEIGSAAMLSRATAGLASHERGGDTFIFAMPGSPHAVALAMRELIVPELGHLVWGRGG